MMLGKVGRRPVADTPRAGSRYASPSGSGDGLTAATPQSLTNAIAGATAGAEVVCAPGIYSTNDGAISKQLDVRPPLGYLGNAVSLSVPLLYPGRGTLGSIINDGYKVTSLVGTAGGGEYWMSIVPSAWAADGSKMGILFMHGASGDETQALGLWPPGLTNIMQALVQAGYPILCPYAGGNAWGNATAQTLMDDARTYLQGTMGAKAGKIGLIGASMGGLSCLNWAKNHMSATACVVGLVPVSDVSDIHTNNRGALAGQINTAYSTWTEGTYGASYNPHTYASTGLTGLPYKAWYGATDAIVINTTVTDVVTAIGGTASGVSVTGDHTTALTTAGRIPPADVLTFVNANAT